MNTAVTCARLSAPTAFFGRVSTDEYGDMIWAHLDESGVDMRLTERGDEPTCRAVVEGDPPVFHFYGDGTADRMITNTDLSAIGAGPHILHGGTLGMFRTPAAETYAQAVEAHDGLVSLDPNCRPEIVGVDGRSDWLGWLHRWLTHADLFRASDSDIEWIWPDESVEVVAARLLDAGMGAVIVTSAGGAIAYTPDGTASASAQKVEVVDTVGAGDSFVGGILTRLHEADVRTAAALRAVSPDDWAIHLDFACRVAAITVSRKGADPPWRAELSVE